VVPPVGLDTGLNLFIKTLLHRVHVVKLVGLDALVLRLFPAGDGLLEGVGATTLGEAIAFCH